jgi:class 3 adenylate cyclase/tetratricopeptide (TPR) repeat protein
MRCAQCGADAPPGFVFCGQCGAPLAASRPAPAPASARARTAYTPRHLADKILKSRSALEGERRQVTVVFADLAGFTALAETLDPEDVHRIIDHCFELITAEVHRFEGTINQYTGDGVMALFGAPIAHEDGPRRAVHAALGIQRAIHDYGKALRAESGHVLQMRIGINTGPVVVGRIGDDLRMDYTAVGDTTNLAARLQQGARPGGVVVSEATHRLVAGFFETLDLGELALKGHGPVRAFEVLRARGRKARLDVAVERGLTPLVGRDRELDALVALFQKAARGHGQVAFVAGEAGIGKSRLLYEFRHRLAQGGEDATWLEGRCVSYGASIPLVPIVDQLRENFGVEEQDGEPEIIAKVEHGMRRMGQLDEHIAPIRYALSVDPGDPVIEAMDAQARRRRIFDAVRALSLRGTAFRPIILVVEDLHWIDSSSEEFLAYFVDSVASTRMLLLLTHRLGYNPPFGTRSFASTLTLDALSETEALAMAGGVLGSDRFPSELRVALMDKAEGVPLFVEEVTKTLLDLGVLRRENGGYRMVEGSAQVAVPDTIHGIIMARLDRLGEDGKRTVQLASVIGRQFMRRLLERIAGLSGELEGLLRELKALEIIYEQGLLAEPAYIFKHAVIQDVAYNSLLRERRRDLHRAVGQAIEELYADRLAEHHGELAHHFTQAEEWAKALDYSVRAGDRAAHAFANAEARRHYARALEAAARVEPALPAGSRAALHTKHAGVLTSGGHYDEADAEYGQARALAREAGDHAGEVESLAALSLVHLFAHRPDAAIRSAEETLTLAREVGDPGLQSYALATRVFAMSGGYGRIPDTLADAEEALRLSGHVGDPRRRALVLVWVGCTFQWRGDFGRALQHLGEAAALAQEHNAGFPTGQSAFMSGHAHLALGNYEEALLAYQRLERYATASGDPFFLSRAPNSLAGVHLELFDVDEAIRLGREGDEISQRLFRWPEPRGHSLVKVGAGYLLRGEHGRAEQFLDRATRLLEQDVWLRWRWHMPLLHVRAELALREARLDDAWTLAGEALAIATQSDSRKHAARAGRLQGQILAAVGRLEEALSALQASVDLAQMLKTPREVWLGQAALAAIYERLGRDTEAEREMRAAASIVDGIARDLTTPGLRRAFLGAEPVVEVYRRAGHRPPPLSGRVVE